MAAAFLCHSFLCLFISASSLVLFFLRFLFALPPPRLHFPLSPAWSPILPFLQCVWAGGKDLSRRPPLNNQISSKFGAVEGSGTGMKWHTNETWKTGGNLVRRRRETEMARNMSVRQNDWSVPMPTWRRAVLKWQCWHKHSCKRNEWKEWLIDTNLIMKRKEGRENCAGPGKPRSLRSNLKKPLETLEHFRDRDQESRLQLW